MSMTRGLLILSMLPIFAIVGIFVVLFHNPAIPIRETVAASVDEVWVSDYACNNGVPQSRLIGIKAAVPLGLVKIFDGDPDIDTVTIAWPDGGQEVVRILGIDGAEIAHLGLWSEDQVFGPEGRGFILGVLATTERLELLRSPCFDKYGRTLGYLFVDGVNYSTLAINSGLAFETVAKYGDNGLPEQAAEVLETADRFGEPYLDQSPSEFRHKMKAKYAKP